MSLSLSIFSKDKLKIRLGTTPLVTSFFSIVILSTFYKTDHTIECYQLFFIFFLEKCRLVRQLFACFWRYFVLKLKYLYFFINREDIL